VDDKPITLRDGRFVILHPIGEGAQGRTFDGVDKREGRVVAIKRFDVRGARSWKDVELAEREARVLQSLSHPKLPAYVDHFEEDGALYLVMEKIEGESLGAYRMRRTGMSEKEVVRLLQDASEVLDYLHGRASPVIHRDLKPGNVIRRPDGSFAFVDFGAVRDRLRPKGGSTVVGTFGYMAPEQLQGRALPASDVYAIGATAVTLLTGSEPEDLPHRGLAIDVREVLRGRASAGLIDVLGKMLDPDPDRRASRIAPLLARLGGRRSAADHRDARAGPTSAEQYSRRVERSARHAARRAEHAVRQAARRQPMRRRHPLPWMLRLFLSLGLTAAIIAVAMTMQVIVPMVLLVLSSFFARRSLMAAAAAVRSAGHLAVDAMIGSRGWFVPRTSPFDPAESTDARMRVDEETAERARVAIDDDHTASAEEEEEASVRRRR
jgi:hypothetical protein